MCLKTVEKDGMFVHSLGSTFTGSAELYFKYMNWLKNRRDPLTSQLELSSQNGNASDINFLSSITNSLVEVVETLDDHEKKYKIMQAINIVQTKLQEISGIVGNSETSESATPDSVVVLPALKKHVEEK